MNEPYDDDFNTYREPIIIGNDFSQLFACGKNENYELTFRGYKVIDTPSGTTVPKNKAVHYVSSGATHAAMITTDGSLYMLGSSLHGKLGLLKCDAMNVATPKLLVIERDNPVVQVVCGDYHTLTLMGNGEVYGWGGNLHKKLVGNAGVPTKIEILAAYKIVKIACGDFHSMALSCMLKSNWNALRLGRWRHTF